MNEYLARMIKEEAGEAYINMSSTAYFSGLMRKRLNEKSDEGRGGWYNESECDAEYLRNLLIEKMEDKNDEIWIDIANYCMMLHMRGIAKWKE